MSVGRDADTAWQPGSFWETAQPGFKFSDAPVGSSEFFAEVERHRYRLEPHILDVVPFDRARDRDVLEVGCGVGTDGLRFARAGARYTGVDQALAAVELASRNFARSGLDGRFARADATSLPFGEQFDLAYSHGVIHHIPDTQQAIRELYRVLRPGGRVLAMVYHRRSLNYMFTIMTLRRLLAGALLSRRAMGLVARLTGEDRRILEGHRALLKQYGIRYLTDRGRFLTHNTDGPGNGLSKVYTGREIVPMFARAGFEGTRSVPHGWGCDQAAACSGLGVGWPASRALWTSVR